MSSHNQLPLLVKELTMKSSLFSLQDFARILDLSAEECAELLTAFVASGVLRKTITDDGEIYYWLVQDPNEKKAGSE